MSDRRPALKFGIFALLCALCAAWLISVTGNIRFFARTAGYAAEMEDATGLLKRDSVLLAGVRVGTVRDVSVERGRAVVRFDIDRDIDILDTWEVGIRWRNVIGQRFLYLYPVGGGERLEAGERLAVERSRPTADIGRFFERLTPLLEAIDPAQQNKLLVALNEALEGKEERIQELVTDLGSLSSTLADRQDDIRTVISQGANLLDAYAQRDQEIKSFLTDFAEVSRTLRARNDVLVGAVTDAGDVQRRLEELLRANHDAIRTELESLDAVASRIGEQRDTVEKAVATLKDGFATYMLISRWGQWFNVRAVATQVQNDGQVENCQAEEGNPCEVPNSRPSSGGASASGTARAGPAASRLRRDRGWAPVNLTFLERNQVVIGGLAALAIVAAVVGGLAVQGGIFKGGYTLTAEFADAAGLSAGDHVFVAGVRSGTVEGLELDGDRVLVTFNVDTELPDATRAKIILRTLVGARAMELVPAGSWDRLLADGDVIPRERTDVPVDIPEFGEVAEDLLSQTDTAALDEFLKAVTEITRGQRAQVGALIEGGRRIAAVVSDQEQDVRRLIRGLRSLGETLQARDQELATIVDEFGEVVAQLAARKEELRRFLRATNSASAVTADLVADEREELDRILTNVHIASDIVSRHQLDLAEALAYAGDAITGFASISYSGRQKVPWGYVMTTSLGTLGVDTISGCGGLIDQYFDQILGPDPRPCSEQDNSTFPEDTPNADEDVDAAGMPVSVLARRALPVRDALALLAAEAGR